MSKVLIHKFRLFYYSKAAPKTQSQRSDDPALQTSIRPGPLGLTGCSFLFRQRSPEERYNLCTGAGFIRAEGIGRRAERHALLHAPEDGIRIIGGFCNICKPGAAAGRRALLRSPQEHNNLRAGAERIRAQGCIA